jgi:hypothetical protein
MKKIMIARAYTHMGSINSEVIGPELMEKCDIGEWIDVDVDNLFKLGISLQYIVTHENGKSEISPILKCGETDATVQAYDTEDATDVEVRFWREGDQPKWDMPYGTLKYRITFLPDEA